MRNLTLLLLSAATAAVLASPRPARAQRSPAPPPKRSFSNGPASTKSAAGERRQATEEELADAVLGDAMNRLWEQTDEHFHQGEYNHAVALNRIIVQGDPHNVEAYASSAWLLWSMGRNEDAESLLNEGIAANPSTSYMYDEMGIYWNIERKDPKAAIPYFEKAAKFDCPFTTWNSLANCYEKTDQWDKAVAAWEKATLYPDNRVAITRLKRARQHVAQQNSGK
jgi:tetratricopeptide (TPR) repeat protein